MSELLLHTITLKHYLVLSATVFVIGLCGIFLNRKNLINIIMCIELVLLSVNINFAAFSVFLGDIKGQIAAMFVLTIAAAEAAIGLAILLAYFRNVGSIEISDIRE